MARLKTGAPKKLSEEWLEKAYTGLNRAFFGYRLPSVGCGIRLYWSDRAPSIRRNERKLYGSSIYGTTEELVDESGKRIPPNIIIASALRTHPCWAECVLLHEMCHVRLEGHRGDSHGPKFRKEMRKLMLKGAFEDIL